MQEAKLDVSLDESLSKVSRDLRNLQKHYHQLLRRVSASQNYSVKIC